MSSFFNIIIKKYDNDLYRLIVKKPSNNIKIKKAKHVIYDYKLLNSLSRSRSKIFEYAYCNNFDYFVTLTLNPEKYDVYDLKKYIKDLSQFIRDYRKKYNVNIQYLLIPERHKSGAWHLHGLIKNLPFSHLSINNNNYLDWKNYSDKFGYMSLSPVQSKIKVSKYITKYITKSIFSQSIINNKNQKIYYVSRGLKSAVNVYNSDVTAFKLSKQNFDYDFQNDFVALKDLNKNEFLEYCEKFQIKL